MRRQRIERGHATAPSVIVERRWHAMLATWAESALQARLIGWLRGPENMVRLNTNGTIAANRLRRWRPTRLILAPDLVLRKRITVPREQHGELRNLVDLLIRAETPFTPGEVFGRVLVTTHKAANQPRFELMLVPRWVVDDALKTLRIRPRHLSGIVLDDGNRVVHLGPQRALAAQIAGAALWAAPVLVAVTAMSAVVSGELTHRHQVLAELQSAVATETALLRDTVDQQDAVRAEQARLDAIEAAVGPEVPVGWLLAALRGALPQEAEIGALEIRDGALRLQVQAPDALGLARTLDQALPSWTVSVDGTITTDPRGGEAATILIAEARARL